MNLMIHSSRFLLPDFPADNGPSLSYALVVLNQPIPRFTPLLWNHARLRVCADGGANRLYDELPQLFPNEQALAIQKRIVNYRRGELTLKQKGPKGILREIKKPILAFIATRYKPDVIKGDMDSIRAEVLEFYTDLGTKTIDASQDQDTTDLHKCVAYIRDLPNLENHNLCILVAGALGGRFDHEVGNINVLCFFSTTRIILLSDDCLIQLLPSSHRHEIHIQSSVEGPHCGLIPIGIPSKSTTTTGLHWDLTDTEMKFGGLISTSNIVKGERVTVRSDSDLLWTISIKKA